MKPHLSRIRFGWQCRAGSLYGYGATPRAAYDRLLAYCARLNATGMTAYRPHHEGMN